MSQSSGTSSSTTATRTRSASASATSTGPAATHTIKVGWPIGDHKMTPEQTTAKKGDTILFEFWPKNHSVVMMDDSTPCIPYNKVKTLPVGSALWWSGFFPFESDDVNDRAYNTRTYTVTLDTEDPVWFYCSQTESCEDYGMIGVVNNREGDDYFQEIKARAISKDYSLSPGESIPEEGGPKTNPSSSSTPDSSSSSLSPGAIAGIVIGGVAALALIGILFFLLGRRKKSAPAASTLPPANPHHSLTPGMGHDPYSPMMQTASPVTPLSMMNTGATGYTEPPGYEGAQRLSVMSGGTVGGAYGKQGHLSGVGEAGVTGDEENGWVQGNRNRLSELPSNSQEPVEIYTQERR
ncbi:hypothetical protein EX30DRAFT_373663 [Ascodesmis nigricans]|uniref:Cupredoxin n=1 Tax=Ascodesmis nigricans TaxID=341454 RepID=A0A4S2MNG4_9PEZI|nr:hypothetical protein EX30DRAFT_373663 [Ascodesmis nigricans]